MKLFKELRSWNLLASCSTRRGECQQSSTELFPVCVYSVHIYSLFSYLFGQTNLINSKCHSFYFQTNWPFSESHNLALTLLQSPLKSWAFKWRLVLCVKNLCVLFETCVLQILSTTISILADISPVIPVALFAGFSLVSRNIYT